jgi:radical SAM protein with 4Fe4S-binding SPASM domain
LAVHLEIVAACNLTCSHCFAGVLPRNHHPLTLPELDLLFGDLASIGSFRLGLTGGEPLLRKDLFDILDAAAGRGLHPCLTTNGLLITEEIARALGKREMVWLNVSLEGPSAECNDAIRGSGTFTAVLDKLRILRRHTRFTLAFTIMQTNAHLVKQCAELAYELGAHTAVFRPLYPAGVALEHLDLMPTFAQYQKALHELAEMDNPASGKAALEGARSPSSQGTDLHGLDPFSPEIRSPTQPQIHTSHTCGAGNHVCSISVQGDVNPCSFLGPAFNVDNIRQRPFPVIWRHNQKLRRLRPAGAASQEGFRGGCRARAQTYSGSIDRPDPWYEEFLEGARPALHPGANVDVAVTLTGRRPLPVLPSI